MRGKKVKEIRKFLLKPEHTFLLFIQKWFGTTKTQRMSGASFYRTVKKMYKQQHLNSWFKK